MYQTNQSKRALLLGAASVLAIAVAGPAVAQDSSVETVVVTGSRIPQQGLYSSSPVTSIGSQEATYQGTTNVENLLNNLPSVVADQTEGVTNGSTGTATVDLRDLGSKRTLVLVDGKRLQPGDAFASGGSADLNIIPVQLIDHVEVLTGGASATYGSDALAGVVNFITRKDFEGAEITGQYNVTQNDNDSVFPRGAPGSGNLLDQYGIARPQKNVFDGQTSDIHLLIGANSPNDKGNVTFYAGYQNIQPILENARDFSSCSAGDTGFNGVAYTYHSCGGSSTVPEGKFVSIDQGNANSVAGLVTGDPGYVNPTNYATQAHTFSHTSPGAFNYAPFNYLQRPDTRYTAGASAHYEFSKSLDVYSSLMFMDDHTLAQVAPGGAFQTPFTINCDNPLLSAQQEATICPAGATSINNPANVFAGNAAADAGKEATVLIGRRSVEAGNRIDDLRHTDYRIVIGAKGDLGNSWNYDLSGQYGVAILADAQEGYFSNKNFQNALQVTSVGGVPTCESVVNGSDPSCVPINVFTAPTLNASRSAAISSPLTAAQLHYVSANGLAQGQTTEYVVSGTLTGDLGAWGGQSPWAKSPIGASVGGEYRQETITYTPDQELVQGDLSGLGGQRTPINGAYNVSEVFGEVRIPIIQGLPFAEDLTATGGYRYSSYSSVGATSTYKYGLEWQPIDDIKFRAGFDRAVRAPNVSELFSTPDVVLFAGQDPCANNGTTNAAPKNTASLRAFCQASGLVNFGTGGAGDKYGAILPCPAAQCNQETSGNPNLTPETSDTKTLGVVFTPTFLDGFTATVDYFDIEVKHAINSYGASFLLTTCQSNPSSPACGLIHRDPVTGFLFTPSGYVENPTSNLGYFRTKGLDFESNYQTSLDDWGMNGWGTFAAAFLGTYTQSFETSPLPTTNVFFTPGSNKQYNCAGLYGDVCGTPQPKWRHSLRLTWGTPWDVNLSVAWRHLQHVYLDQTSGNANLQGAEGENAGGVNTGASVPGCAAGAICGVDARIPSYDYFDVSGQWSISQNLTMTAGVTNILDKGPPINGLALGNGNTFTGTYDYLGRQLFVSGTLKF